jgi:hypothetical protein
MQQLSPKRSPSSRLRQIIGVSLAIVVGRMMHEGYLRWNQGGL